MDHLAPADVQRIAKPDEAQGCLCEHGRGHSQSELSVNDLFGIDENVAKDNISVRAAKSPGSLDERHIPQLQDARVHDARCGAPPQEAHHKYDVPHARA